MKIWKPTPGEAWTYKGLTGYRFRLLGQLAYATLLWEITWPQLWPACSFLGLFFCIALLDGFKNLLFWQHVLILAFFTLVFCILLIRGLLKVPKITSEKLWRHVEIVNGISDRALTEVSDKLGLNTDEKFAQDLWYAHKNFLSNSIRHIRVPLPNSSMAEKDPRGFRFFIPILLVVSIFASYGEIFKRVSLAFSPSIPVSFESLKINFWVVPPLYTEVTPEFFERRIKELELRNQEKAKTISIFGVERPINIPVDSKIIIQLGGSRVSPLISIGSRKLTGEILTYESKKMFQAETKIVMEDIETREVRIQLNQHIEVLVPIIVQEDKAPTVGFLRSPSRTANARLGVQFEANDDYGISKAEFIGVRPKNAISSNRDLLEIRETLPVPSGDHSFQAFFNKDFSGHPWAGLPVLVRLEASDQRAQTGSTEQILTVLPERLFNHPVAQKLAEIKKKISILDDQTRKEIIGSLENLLDKPMHFNQDFSIYLGIKIVATRLKGNISKMLISDIQKLLWDMALHIEDGEYAIAANDMVSSHGTVMKALNGDITGKELKRLMDNMKLAIKKFIDQLAKRIEEESLVNSDITRKFEVISRDIISEKIDRIRDLANTGSRLAAQELMANLMKTLRELQARIENNAGSKLGGKARGAVKGLKGLIHEQQDLMDFTYKKNIQTDSRSKQLGTIEKNAGHLSSNKSLMKEQQRLRSKLRKLTSEIQKSLGNVPGAVGSAAKAMDSASEVLLGGKLGAAVSYQGKAVEELRKSVERVIEGFRRKSANGGGQMIRGLGIGGRGMEDFFDSQENRFPQAGGTRSKVKIPNQQQVKKAKKLLDELRRRSSQQYRPIVEREYIKRLLKQY